MGRTRRGTHYGRRMVPYAAGGAANIGRQLFTALRHRHRGLGSHTRTNRRRPTSGKGITNQYDRRLIYRKKHMPRGKKRRWASFVRKTHAASEKDLGSKTVVINNQLSLSDSGAAVETRQLLGVVSLYNMTDLRNITANDSTVNKTSKFLFQSGVLDITYRQLSTEHDETTGSLPISCELDVYEITASRSFQAVTGAQTLLQAFQDGFDDTTTISGAGTPIALGNRGATPWDGPESLSQFRIKIHKKTKYFLGYGQTMTYQVRDPKRHSLGKEYITTTTGNNCPGRTKFILFVQKVVPGAVTGAGYTIQATVGHTRKFMYKIKEQSADKDNIL